MQMMFKSTFSLPQYFRLLPFFIINPITGYNGCQTKLQHIFVSLKKIKSWKLQK